MAYPNLGDYDWVCPDTETDGLDWHRGSKPFSLAIMLSNGYSEYYDFRRDHKALDWAREQFPKIKLAINHNIKFDIHMLRVLGINLDPRICECTMIRASLIDEHLFEYNLDVLSKKYLGKGKYGDIYEELAKIFGGAPTRSKQAPNFHRAPESLMKRYAIPDVERASELWLWQEKEIERQGLQQVWALEKRLFPHIVEMERRGIRVDEYLAERTMGEASKRIDMLQHELNKHAGFIVNPNPSKSLTSLFDPKQDKDGNWFAKDGTPLEKTGAGNPSIGKAALKAMKDPAGKMVIQLRELKKMRDTFIGGHILSNSVNGYVHPNINQVKGEKDDGNGTEGTGTGRLSYTGPALQQIPARNKLVASMVRPIFLPDEGQKWSYGDLDQHEFRIFAHYAKPPKLLKAYAENPDLDMHQIVADLTGMPRSAPDSGGANAKQINLAMVFNMGGGELASQMGLPFHWETAIFRGETEPKSFKKAGEEALAVMDRYYKEVEGVREVARQATALATSRGYVITRYGRHIRFPRGMYTYKASGLIYQGTAGDFNKENICLLAEYMASECPHNRLLLNIHDEYSMSLQDEGDITVKHLKEMRRLIEDKGLRVPIRIDFGGLADNWWEATKTPLVTS